MAYAIELMQAFETGAVLGAWCVPHLKFWVSADYSYSVAPGWSDVMAEKLCDFVY